MNKLTNTNQRDKEGYTPLIAAIVSKESANSEEIIEVLLKNGADPNLRCRITEGDEPPMSVHDDEMSIDKEGYYRRTRQWFTALQFVRLWINYFEGVIENEQPDNSDPEHIYLIQRNAVKNAERNLSKWVRLEDILKKYGAK